MDSAAHMVITGVVQGVGYRYFVLRLGRELGLKGYVRNLYSGDVEVEAEGEEGLISEFIRALRVGPPSAHVIDVQVTWHRPDGKYADFEVKF